MRKKIVKEKQRVMTAAADRNLTAAQNEHEDVDEGEERMRQKERKKETDRYRQA